MCLAHVHGAEANGQTLGSRLLDDVVPDLLHQFLLDLQAGSKMIDDAVVLRQPDDLSTSGGQYADVCLTVDWHHVMRAG